MECQYNGHWLLYGLCSLVLLSIEMIGTWKGISAQGLDNRRFTRWWQKIRWGMFQESVQNTHGTKWLHQDRWCWGWCWFFQGQLTLMASQISVLLLLVWTKSGAYILDLFIYDFLLRYILDLLLVMLFWSLRLLLPCETLPSINVTLKKYIYSFKPDFS